MLHSSPRSLDYLRRYSNSPWALDYLRCCTVHPKPRLPAALQQFTVGLGLPAMLHSSPEACTTCDLTLLTRSLDYLRYCTVHPKPVLPAALQQFTVGLGLLTILHSSPEACTTCGVTAIHRGPWTTCDVAQFTRSLYYLRSYTAHRNLAAVRTFAFILTKLQIVISTKTPTKIF